MQVETTFAHCGVELGDAGKGGGVLQEGHYPDGETRGDSCGRGLVDGWGREGGREGVGNEPPTKANPMTVARWRAW